MIRHIVLIRFREDVPLTVIADIFKDLVALTDKLPGVRSITCGTSDSPEKMERGYMHGFVVDFEDGAALEGYQDDADHRVIGGRLIENAVGGRDGILVFDLPVGE